MAKVNKWITARKAVFTLLKIAVVAGGSITATQVTQLEAGGEVAVVAGMGIIGAVLRAWNNVRKQSERPPVEYHTRGYLMLLAPALCLGALAGCITTTAPDGTQTVRVDGELLETAWDRYEALEARRIALEAEQDRADAARRAEIAAELRRLGPEIRSAAQDVGIIPKE